MYPEGRLETSEGSSTLSASSSSRFFSQACFDPFSPR